MKRYILILIAAVAATLTMAAAGKGAEIKFDSQTYEMGTIHASKGNVTATYTFTNTGTEPLVIISVSNGGCGCTRPSYPKQPIAPGKQGVITINFNPAGRRGELNREVKVKSNAVNGKTQRLRFTGVIIPD